MIFQSRPPDAGNGSLLQCIRNLLTRSRAIGYDERSKNIFDTLEGMGMARAIGRTDINAKARPKLSKVISTAMVYVLEGTPRRGRADEGRLVLWAEYPRGTAAELIIDLPAWGDEPEFFQSVKIGETALDALIDHITPPPVLPRGGRPVKYGRDAREKVQRMRGEGVSIRGIAAAMGCSTATVQKLLR